jgi:proteasome component ECM29
VLLNFGLCDNDEQFESRVNKFLAPVLLKIESTNEEVRKKVMEILTHVNKRLKSRSNINLEITQILKHYKESSNSFLINFAIIYIIIGFNRADPAKKSELAHLIIDSLEKKPQPHQDKLLLLIVPTLNTLALPEDIENRKKIFGLHENQNVRKIFLSILSDVLHLPYGHSNDAEIPPGMSNYSYKRVLFEDKGAEFLENTKKGIIKFISSDIFDENEIIPHLVIASSDTRYSVSTPALNELNKICT